jgi:single-strand DNA-binding protein
MATRSINKVILVGNLVRDPELRYTPQNTAVANFTVATNRSWTGSDGNEQESVEYSRIVAWGKLAEIVDQILKKGRKVYVEGRLQTREWEGQDGQKNRRTEVVAEQVLALDSLRGTSGSQGDGSDYSYPDKGEKSSKDSDNELKVEDEVGNSDDNDVEKLADDIPF